MAEVVAAQQAPNAQQQQDGLPVWTLYRDTPDSGNLPGPRSPGSYVWANGQDFNSYGILSASSQDPAPSPLQTGLMSFALRGCTRGVFNPPAQKVLIEPKQFVPGQGWIGLADVAG